MKEMIEKFQELCAKHNFECLYNISLSEMSIYFQGNDSEEIRALAVSLDLKEFVDTRAVKHRKFITFHGNNIMLSIELPKLNTES